MNVLSLLGLVLVVLWAVLWLGLKVVSGLIHFLVIAGVVMIVWGLVSRGASAVKSRM